MNLTRCIIPNIRQQIVGPLGDKSPSLLLGDDIGVYIMASDGRTVTLTKREIQTKYATLTGNRNARRAALIVWGKQQIVAALGEAQIDLTGIAFDFDETDGTPTGLEVA